METQEDSRSDEWKAVSDALKIAEERGDDGPSINILSAEGLGTSELAIGLQKIPLDQASNLILAQECAAAVRRDEYTAEEYLERMAPLIEVVENGVKLFSAEVVKKEAAKLPPEEQEVIALFEEQIYVLRDGVELMLGYIETQAIDDLDRGLELVEKAMQAIDEIQDRALEMAEEYAAREAEEKEAAQAEAQGETQSELEG